MKLEELRRSFDEMFDSINECLSEFDDKFEEYETEHCNSIKDINNFIWELKKQELYDEKMEKFIDEYMKWGNK